MVESVIAAQLNLGPLVWAVLGILAAIGLLAVVSPRRFQTVCRGSDRWVDTDALLEPLNRRIDLDQHVMPFSRLLGVSVLMAVGVLAYLYLSY